MGRCLEEENRTLWKANHLPRLSFINIKNRLQEIIFHHITFPHQKSIIHKLLMGTNLGLRRRAKPFESSKPDLSLYNFFQSFTYQYEKKCERGSPSLIPLEVEKKPEGDPLVKTKNFREEMHIDSPIG